MLVRADPVGEDDLDALVPARHARADPLPGQAARTSRRSTAPTRPAARPARSRRCSALTGIQVNYLVTVDFHGFKQIVDQLGGVWIDVDHRYFNDNGGRTTGDTYATINLWPGYQKLNGSQALDYARFRHTDSDLYRVARQQLFIQALKQQAAGELLPAAGRRRSSARCAATSRSASAAAGSSTSGRSLKYAHFIYGLPNGHFFRGHIDANGLVQDTGSSDLLPDPTSVANAVARIPESAGRRAAAGRGRGAHREGAEEAVVAAPASTSVIVLNGNGVSGSAGTASSLLAAARVQDDRAAARARRRTRRTSATSRTRGLLRPAPGRPGSSPRRGSRSSSAAPRSRPMPADDRPARPRRAHRRDRRPDLPRDVAGAADRGDDPARGAEDAPGGRRDEARRRGALRKKVPFRLAAPTLLDVNSRFDSYVPTPRTTR